MFFLTKIYFAQKEILPPKYFANKKICQQKIFSKKNSFTKNKIVEKNLPRKNFVTKIYCQKKIKQTFFSSNLIFSPKELSWVEIQLTYNLGSWNLAFRLNSQKYDKPRSFLDGSVWWIFGFVWMAWFASPLLLSWEETQLTRNLGSWNFACQFNSKNFGDQIFWDQIMFSSSALIRPSSRQTVSAWVSPSSTPACFSCEATLEITQCTFLFLFCLFPSLTTPI